MDYARVCLGFAVPVGLGAAGPQHSALGPLEDHLMRQSVSAVLDDRVAQVLSTFYRIPRAGAPLLSDEGGPFGFDVHVALAVDHLVQTYGIELLLETGTCRGDTTEYLAAMYPHLPVMTVEVDADLFRFASKRLRDRPNVTCLQGSSAEVLPRVLGRRRGVPLVFLDAHWHEDWPLRAELAGVVRGVTIIDDFDVGDPRFSFDEYGGVACNSQTVEPMLPSGTPLYTLNTSYRFPLPCLQMGRRGGKAFIPIGIDASGFEATDMFRRIEDR